MKEIVSEISSYQYKTLSQSYHENVYTIEFESLQRHTLRDYVNFTNFIFELNVTLTLAFTIYNIVILSCDSQYKLLAIPQQRTGTLPSPNYVNLSSCHVSVFVQALLPTSVGFFAGARAPLPIAQKRVWCSTLLLSNCDQNDQGVRCSGGQRGVICSRDV